MAVVLVTQRSFDLILKMRTKRVLMVRISAMSFKTKLNAFYKIIKNVKYVFSKKRMLTELGRRDGSEPCWHERFPGDNGPDVSEHARCGGQHVEPICTSNGRRTWSSTGSNDISRSLHHCQSVALISSFVFNNLFSFFVHFFHNWTLTAYSSLLLLCCVLCGRI